MCTAPPFLRQTEAAKRRVVACVCGGGQEASTGQSNVVHCLILRPAKNTDKSKLTNSKPLSHIEVSMCETMHAYMYQSNTAHTGGLKHLPLPAARSALLQRVPSTQALLLLLLLASSHARRRCCRRRPRKAGLCCCLCHERLQQCGQLRRGPTGAL